MLSRNTLADWPARFALQTPPVTAPDGARWAFVSIERGKLGNGAAPVHRWGLDWKRTANSLFEAWRAHEIKRVSAEMAMLERAFFLPDDGAA